MKTTPGFTWTDDVVEKLKTLVAEGLSAGLIAREFGSNCSRNAIIGKAFRIGLKFIGSQRVHAVNVDRPRKARPTETEAPALCTIAPLAPTPTMGAWRAAQEDARREQSLAGQTGRSKPTAYHENRRAELLAQIGNNAAGDIARAASKRGLTLMQLRPTSCRWPMGDPMSESFLYCGDPKDGASVYCACHRARAYTPIIRKVRTVAEAGA